MSSIQSSSQPLGSALRWLGLSIIGKGSEFYKNDPAGYESVARVLMGRHEVAQSIRSVVDTHCNHHPRRFVVDVACGSGLIADALVGSADRVVGTDLCPEVLAFARASKDPSIEFRCGDMHDFSSYETGSIDVFSLSFAHRYIQDLQKFYGDLALSLADNGSAIITTAGSRRCIARIEEHSRAVGLAMQVIRPTLRSRFNRIHKTAHVILCRK